MKIENRVKEVFGIELTKYQNEDILENVVELATLPKTAIVFFIKSLIIGLLVYIAGYFIIDLGNIDYLVYGFFGLIGNLFLTIMVSITLFIRKLKNLIIDVVDYWFEIYDMISKLPNFKTEINSVNSNLLFKGILEVIILPPIKNMFSEKIPIVGKYISVPIEKILNKLASKNLTQKVASSVENNDEKTENNISKYVDIVFSTVQKPFYYLSILSLVFNTIFIYLVW